MADLIERDAVLHDVSTECSNAHEAKYYEAQVALTRAKRIIRDAPAVNRWIPVEDEYPEPCKSVLIAFSDSSGVRLQCVGIRSATHPNVWLDMHGGRIKNVTHWQSLPEPPEKE